MTVKNCNKCGELKEITNFHKNVARKDGHIGICKNCCSEHKSKKVDVDILAGKRPERTYTYFNKIERSKIEELYNSGIGINKIASAVNRTKSGVYRYLNSRNIIDSSREYRKYEFININYFDIIDTEDKAYFLGLLWADGCNVRTLEEGKKKRKYVTLALNHKDQYIIEKLANNLYGNADMVYRVSPQKIGYNKRVNNPLAALKLSSSHISDTLMSYGMVPRKSTVLGMPVNIQWNDLLIRSYIRGFLDGDGCITQSKNDYKAKFISSVDHIRELNSVILDFYGKSFKVYDETYESGVTMSVLTIGGNIQCKNFLDWIYEDSTIHLTRKYEKYLKLKCMVESKING